MNQPATKSGRVDAVDVAHIIAFIKDPESEPVKTRLAAHIGSPQAKTVYTMFLAILCEQLVRLQSLGFKGIIAHSPATLSQNVTALFPGFTFIHQGKGNIGERINHIDEKLFGNNTVPRIFIGSDAPTLPDQHLIDAAVALGNTDTVVAPATDGGFVLLGTKRKLPDLSEVPWSQPSTLKATLRALSAGRLTTATIAPWEDIDELESLHRMLTNARQTNTNHTSAVLGMLTFSERVLGGGL